MAEIRGDIGPVCKPGDRIFGYEVKRANRLPDLQANFYLLEHFKSGARHIHIQNQDRESTFSIALKTVPEDSTGVAHVLEHTVLCGSKKFPVRDPFFSMLKRSLNTFMNAFTSSDWTMYPFSTQNRKDFFNLMSVYLDAVFYPNLDVLNFKQEGHRMEFEGNSDSPEKRSLAYKGIVYNEMKGAMSSPEQVMTRSLLKAIYPDTTYRFNSGGDPKSIPQLTPSALKAFHERYYHPSNAYFYTYGDIPLPDILSFIHEAVLTRFDRIDPKTEVPRQIRWKQPRRVVDHYPVSKDETPDKKNQVCVAWLTADVKHHSEVTALTLLEQILLGNAASPMRKALIDSGIGSALSDGTGFIADNRDTLFAFGLKNMAPSDADTVEGIILEVLNRLAKDGIDRDLIDSAIHQLEFHRKEITNRPYPYGLKIMFSLTGTWFHGGDPEKVLSFSSDIEEIRQATASGPFFEEKIKTYFLDNPHRVRFLLAPDPMMEEKESQRVRAELDEKNAGLSPDEVRHIQEDTGALKLLQEMEEDLSSLPTLEIDDIPPTIKTVPASETFPHNGTVYFEQPTSGIFYFSGAMGAGGIPRSLQPYVPFFTHAFTKTGTALHDYTDIVRMIDTYTGGLGLAPHARTQFGPGDTCLPLITFNGKCLVRNQARMFDIIRELLAQSDFSDLIRLKHLLLEYRTGLESMVVPNGHRLALMLASRAFTKSSALDEIWHGVHQLKFFKTITEELTDSSLGEISGKLAAIGRTLLTKSNFKMAVIGDGPSLNRATPVVDGLQDVLYQSPGDGFNDPDIELGAGGLKEGWTTATSVSYVARVFRTVRMGHDDAPTLSVIAKILRSMYLHREIREKGGAYGGFSIYSPEDGLFCFASYRDPHILSTLRAFEGVFDFIKSDTIKEEDVKEAILQVCSDIDKPDPPGPEARKAFYRKIVSLDDDTRARFKQQVLSTTRTRVREIAEKYFHSGDSNCSIAVISGKDKIKTASESYPLSLHEI